ncbi:MAG: type I-E CRISPR-associated protein Cas7/Cse4/CasC [Cyanobacteria bacterium MAG CAR1_bin_15]|nr:type I-E CRISPR-associated protein Cas7/Cse4/CasC [Cyanobacteria bacterium MAG CAR1_bin_15]
MSTFVEFHAIQNVPPSCLNRDDTGAPKDAMFGGWRRSRVSSQCLKRAARKMFANSQLLNEDELGIRTRNIVQLISKKLAGQGESDAVSAIETALKAVDLSVKSREDATPQTEYLLFLSQTGVSQLTDVIKSNLAELSNEKFQKDPKKHLKGDLKKKIAECISTSRAVDIALFGRMLADRKDFNVDAAAQVAHAISTNSITRESDFFTAVDDFTQAQEADAGMLGTVEFNSSCLYRYAAVNLDQLIKNLGHDQALAYKGVEAFLRAAAMAIPTGKQNTFAAHTLPEFVGIAVHNTQPISLANAFQKPVWHRGHENGLAAASVVRLQEEVNKLTEAYSLNLGLRVMDLTKVWEGNTVASLDELIGQSLSAAREKN